MDRLVEGDLMQNHGSEGPPASPSERLAKLVADEVERLLRDRLGIATDSHASLASDEGTNFEKVKAFFNSVDNEPSTTTAIRNATGIPRGSLSNLLYETHKNLFTSHEVQGRKRKLWSLRTAVAEERDFAGLAAHECCRIILLEHRNEPMHVLTLAKEAIRRGYSGRGHYTGDAFEWVTAKSFWARLSRTNRHDFVQVEPNVFRLRNPKEAANRQTDLFEIPEEESEGADE